MGTGRVFSTGENGTLRSGGDQWLTSGAGFGLDSDTGQSISFMSDPIDFFGNRAAFAAKDANKPTWAETKMAEITRDQWADYKKRFQPVEDDILAAYKNPADYKRTLDRAGTRVDASFNAMYGDAPVVAERAYKANDQAAYDKGIAALSAEEKAAIKKYNAEFDKSIAGTKYATSSDHVKRANAHRFMKVQEIKANYDKKREGFAMPKQTVAAQMGTYGGAERQLSRYGVKTSADQQAAQDRTVALTRAATKAAAANDTRALLDERDEQIMTGGLAVRGA